jgi:hypothetical protein
MLLRTGTCSASSRSTATEPGSLRRRRPRAPGPPRRRGGPRPQPPLGAAPPAREGAAARGADRHGPGARGQARAAGALRHAHPRRAAMMQARACAFFLFDYPGREPAARLVHGGPGGAFARGRPAAALLPLASAVHTRKPVVLRHIQSPEFHDLPTCPATRRSARSSPPRCSSRAR